MLIRFFFAYCLSSLPLRQTLSGAHCLLLLVLQLRAVSPLGVLTLPLLSLGVAHARFKTAHPPRVSACGIRRHACRRRASAAAVR